MGAQPEQIPAGVSVRGTDVAVVATGGSIGTALRYALDTAFPAVGVSFPWTTFGINLVGAFLLAALLAVGDRWGDGGWWRTCRLALGTGLLGGLTTYSALAVQTVQRLEVSPAMAALYGVSSAVLGVFAAALGWKLVTAFCDRGAAR